ncbi:hypothetical protein D9611_008947 [Ephemerocybe angulata]|uniref:Proteophosphoglycan ppg4 n=1 Tax=Ephemerocybe angulata TaxID=980116 RepID=A0A8H5C0N7_9AGAR|nr:hypothetical protein D9611_008947 [Tulosesus angulatus]
MSLPPPPASGSTQQHPPPLPPRERDHVSSPSPHPPRDSPRPPSAAASPSAYHFASETRDAAAPSRISSRQSEGYPSWLPRRPPPPAPASTIGTNTPAPFDPDYFNGDEEDLDLDAELRHLDAQYGVAARASTGTEEEEESPVAPNPLLLGGRKPTPRSVRIVNLESPGITEEPRGGATGGAAVGKKEGAAKPSYSTSYAHWKTRDAKRQNRVSSGSTAVAHPSSAVVGAPRGWTRANAVPTMFNSIASSFYPQDSPLVEARPRPRFNTRGLHLELLRSPSIWMKVYYRLWPILNLAHVPLQTFLDFNAVYMLVQASKHPLPNAGPSSAKNWALGAAAYVASWLAWILIIFVVYEIVYSFARRWRVRRPLIFPIYISSPAYTYACMTSFNTFCLLQHLRYTAFVPIAPELDGLASSSSGSSTPRSSGEEEGLEKDGDGDVAQEMLERGHAHARVDSTDSNEGNHETHPALARQHHRTDSHPVAFQPKGGKSKGGFGKKMRRMRKFWANVTWRDGLAETFNLYAQNVANVVTLLPRAGLALALLLAFSPGFGGEVSAFGSSARDSTFFRAQDGLLTGYAEGVLWANVAWTAWRVVVLWVSWMGLWILSGHSCAGICGPRDKWEEEELNRLSASLARARKVPYPNNTSAPTTTTQGNTDANAAIGVGAGRRIIHKRFASNWSNGSNGSSADGDDDVLPWEWRECTRARVQDAWEFCVVGDGGRLRWGAQGQGERQRQSRMMDNVSGAPQIPPLSGIVEEKRPVTPENGKGAGDDGTGLDEAGLQRVLAAVGFPAPGVPTPARRGALRSDLFESPSKRSLSPVIGAAAGAMLSDREGDEEEDEEGVGRRKGSMPLLKLPYPFARPGSGYVSSKEDQGVGLVPFPASASRGGSKRTSRAGSAVRASRSGSEEPVPEEEGDGEGVGEGGEGEPSSSSHNYSSEPSSSSVSVAHPAGSGSNNSLSSLGQPIPPSSAVFVSRGMRPLTASGGTEYTQMTTSHVSHRHSSLGSVMSSSEAGNLSGLSGTSGGFAASASGGGGLDSPGGVAGIGGGVGQGRPGSTRFPFLSGPPPPPSYVSSPSSPSSGTGHVVGMGIGPGPSLHFGVHGRRVAVQHTGGSMGTSTSGSAHGHGYVGGQVMGHRRGVSHTSGFSSGLGSEMGYAASGSGEGEEGYSGYVEDVGEESAESEGVDEFGRTRDRSRASSSGDSAPGVVGGVIPMPRRHPHAGRARAGTAPPSAGVSATSLSQRSGSGSSREAGGIAFPTSDLDNTTAELGVVTGYARGMGMEMLSIEASDSLARRERAGRRGAMGAPWVQDGGAEEEGHGRERTVTAINYQQQDEQHDKAEVDDDDDDMYVRDDEDELRELDEEARGEREDRVGLLSSSLQASSTSLHPHHSPVLGGVDQLGQLAAPEASRSRRSSRRNSTQRRSRESLAAAAASAAGARSRHSSYVRSNRSSPSASGSPTIAPMTPRRDSLLGVARERASSFGVRVRERAQSLMQSVVGSPVRERRTSEIGAEHGHRRLGSGDTGTGVPFTQPSSLPQSPLRAAEAPAMAVRSVSGESSGSGSGVSGIVPIASVGRDRDYGALSRSGGEDEDYYSSSHSRSGSGSVSNGENYTFGRPMPFMRRRESASGAEEEGGLPSPVIEEAGAQVVRPAAARVRTTSTVPSMSSVGEDVFYSPIGGPTPLQSGLTTPVPTSHVPIFHAQQQQQQEQQQQEQQPRSSPQDVPWTQRLLQPPEQGWRRDRSLSPGGDSGSGDRSMMLSSAAASFVTAPAADGQSVFTATTGGGSSSEAGTVTGSWEERQGGFVGAFLSGTAAGTGRGSRRRESGFVERVGEGGYVPGAGGLGDGRIA